MRSGPPWYYYLLLGLAAMIVYPDKILDELSDRTGREFGWQYVLVLEAVAIGLMIVAMHLLTPRYPKLTWWLPVLFVGGIAAIRFLMWRVVRMFGFDDD
jgi:hypothetical protein